MVVLSRFVIMITLAMMAMLTVVTVITVVFAAIVSVVPLAISVILSGDLPFEVPLRLLMVLSTVVRVFSTDGMIILLSMVTAGVIVAMVSFLMMLVGWIHLFGVSMIVAAFFVRVVHIRSRHSVVLWAMLLIFVVIGIILMAVRVLRSHVVMARVLIMMGDQIVMDWSSVLLVVRSGLMVDRRNMMSDSVVDRLSMMSDSVVDRLSMMSDSVMNSGLMMRLLVVRLLVVGLLVMGLHEVSLLVMSDGMVGDFVVRLLMMRNCCMVEYRCLLVCNQVMLRG